jgi:hypothetical protein
MLGDVNVVPPPPPCLTDKRRANDPPALHRTPRVGEVLTVDDRSHTNDRSDNQLSKIQ